jgi:putative Holliday junction resolvase
LRILALDWGTVRIGAAISDPEGKIAFPLEKFIDSKNAAAEIKSLVEEKEVEKILLGIPKSLAGTDTESTKLAQKFGESLQGLGIPVENFDERLSSQGASKFLSSLGFNQKQQRGKVDNLAASQMLQAYLDTK